MHYKADCDIEELAQRITDAIGVENHYQDILDALTWSADEDDESTCEL